MEGESLLQQQLREAREAADLAAKDAQAKMHEQIQAIQATAALQRHRVDSAQLAGEHREQANYHARLSQIHADLAEQIKALQHAAGMEN